MIVYSIEIYEKNSEDFVSEVDIPNNKLDAVAEIMKWNTNDKNSFVNGIGDFNVTEEQSRALESLLGVKFYADDLIIQISGGEI